jgi:hypothetical protein
VGCATLATGLPETQVPCFTGPRTADTGSAGEARAAVAFEGEYQQPGETEVVFLARQETESDRAAWAAQDQ